MAEPNTYPPHTNHTGTEQIFSKVSFY